LEQVQELKSPRSCCTVGKFEAFHRGHRKLIEKAKEVCSSVKVGSIRGLGLRLFSERERAEIAKELKIELINLPFERIKDQTPEEFMEFLSKMGCSVLVVGKDWKFGKGKKGNVESAKEIGKKLGMKVLEVETEKESGKKISTSRIVELLTQGKIEDANRLLGFPYFLMGRVVRGMQLGRKLGFPTLNVKLEKELFLPFGVYVVRACFGGECFRGVANFGRAPTLKEKEPTLEVFIPNRNLSDSYGEVVRVEFFKFLREEKKFKSVEELSSQIKLDVEVSKQFWREFVGAGKAV